MKAFFLYLLAVPVALFAACSDSNSSECELYDYVLVGASFEFRVTDPAGNNLLDPDYENNILDLITINYLDKEYTYREKEEGENYVYPSISLDRWGDPKAEQGLLYFGYIAKATKGEQFTIDWGLGGDQDNVWFEYYTTWDDEECVHHIFDKVKYNGVETEMPIHVVLDPAQGE